MNKKKNKNKFNFQNLSNIQRLILSVCALLFLLLAISIGNLIVNRDNINYAKASAQTFLADGVETRDRQVYWDLNDIIADFIESYRFQENADGEYGMQDYEEALTHTYRNYLGTSKYKTLATSFLEKFVIDTGEEKNVITSRFIKSIYKIHENRYFCELEGANEVPAYIGIDLDTKNHIFKIFYME